MEPLSVLLARVFNTQELPDSAGMADVQGWDSLTHMDLIAQIEETYSLELTGDEIAEMQSIGSIREILARRGVE